MSKMSKTVYTVHAYRWGDREYHSYSVGVYSNKHAALNAAQTESDYRGGKYKCEVLEWTLDTSIAGNHDNAAKVIKPLPPMNNAGAVRAALAATHEPRRWGFWRFRCNLTKQQPSPSA
jgi:hypothetical protein